MKLTFAIAVALSLVSLAFAGECYSKCRFHFCDGTTKFNPKAYAPDTPFKGRLCDKYGKIHLGTVDESGEALILSKYSHYGKPAVRISKFEPKGLKQNFSPSFFKTFSVKGYYKTKYGKVVYSPYFNYGSYTPHKYSSVGVETSQQGQIEFLNKKCVILPFKKYQVLDKYGRNVIDNVNTEKVFIDCVAFKVDFGKKKYGKVYKKEENKYEKEHKEEKYEKEYKEEENKYEKEHKEEKHEKEYKEEENKYEKEHKEEKYEKEHKEEKKYEEEYPEMKVEKKKHVKCEYN